MTMLIALIVSALLVVAALFVLTPLIVHLRPRATPIARVVTVLTLAVLVGTVALTVNATRQGMWTLDTPLEDVIDITVSGDVPYDQSSEVTDTTSTVIAFYRYGCPDCKATYDDIVSWAASEDIPLVWVSTRSERGRELFMNSGLNKVPSLLATDAHDETLARVAYLVDPTTDHAKIDDTALDAIAAFVRGE